MERAPLMLMEVLTVGPLFCQRGGLADAREKKNVLNNVAQTPWPSTDNAYGPPPSPGVLLRRAEQSRDGAGRGAGCGETCPMPVS
eukprot:11465643-Heterocapsa_arctica.AAC.1